MFFTLGDWTSNQVQYSFRFHGLVTRTSGRGDTSDCCGASNVSLPRALLGLRPREQFVVPRRGTEVSCRTWHTLQTLFVGRIGEPSGARTVWGRSVSQQVLSIRGSRLVGRSASRESTPRGRGTTTICGQ